MVVKMIVKVYKSEEHEGDCEGECADDHEAKVIVKVIEKMTIRM